jgi:hypothetical protein
MTRIKDNPREGSTHIPAERPPSPRKCTYESFRFRTESYAVPHIQAQACAIDDVLVQTSGTIRRIGDRIARPRAPNIVLTSTLVNGTRASAEIQTEHTGYLTGAPLTAQWQDRQRNSPL